MFASGNGSNALSILEHALEFPDRFAVQAVLCDRPDAPIVGKMREWSAPLHVVPPPDEAAPESRRAAHEREILSLLGETSVDWICLAGFMRRLSPAFLARFHDGTTGLNRVLNIHPSLLPAFPGKDGYGDAWRYGVAVTGCTVHFVDDGLDTGPVLLQSCFRIHPGEGPDSVRKRGLMLEHDLYRRSLDIVQTGAFRSENRGGRLVVLPEASEKVP